MEAKTTYFEKPGEENTEEVLELVKNRAQESGIKTIVIASTRGNTAVKAVEVLKGLRVIAVSHVAGFSSPGTQEFILTNRELVESKSGIVLTTGHAFSGLSRAMRNKHNMYLLGDIVADTLRIFGQGTKVACEIALMVADTGLLAAGEEIISVGGTGRGADTALVLTPSNTHTFFDLKVREFICKPR
jgi:hypothetical protein